MPDYFRAKSAGVHGRGASMSKYSDTAQHFNGLRDERLQCCIPFCCCSVSLEGVCQ